MKKLIFLLIIFCGISYGVEPIQPIPTGVPYNGKKAKIGKILFHDPSLSKDGTVSCLSCHNIYANCGTDRKEVSTGAFGKKGKANAPTVFNAVFNFRQFWNGRAKDLKEQVFGPISNPVEMGLSPKEVEEKVNKNEIYKKMFKKVYKKDYITLDMIADAIAEYEKTLITPDSKFDLYLKGKVKLTKDEMEGYLLFKRYGCVSCHNGVNVGGNSFQKFGAVIPAPWKPDYPDRYQITKKEEDKNVYKVPSLRNVECTYPYFHSGKIKKLEKAVEIMAYHNLGIKLPSKDIKKIVSFLKTLTGKKEFINK